MVIKPISKWEFKRELNDLGKSGLFLENAKKMVVTAIKDVKYIYR